MARPSPDCTVAHFAGTQPATDAQSTHNRASPGLVDAGILPSRAPILSLLARYHPFYSSLPRLLFLVHRETHHVGAQYSGDLVLPLLGALCGSPIRSFEGGQDVIAIETACTPQGEGNRSYPYGEAGTSAKMGRLLE